MSDLPTGTEPLVLADGTTINPVDGGVVTSKDKETLIEVPSHFEIQRDIVAARRRVSDLPVPPKQMNTISIILTYTMMGVNVTDIANLLNLTVEQVQNVKMSEAFTEVQEKCIEAIIAHDKDFVRNAFVEQSRQAASNMFQFLGDENKGIRMEATKDVLDRAGHRPADVVEHRHKVEGGLRIEYVDSNKNDVPVIDVEHEEL